MNKHISIKVRVARQEMAAEGFVNPQELANMWGMPTSRIRDLRKLGRITGRLHEGTKTFFYPKNARPPPAIKVGRKPRERHMPVVDVVDVPQKWGMWPAPPGLKRSWNGWLG